MTLFRVSTDSERIPMRLAAHNGRLTRRGAMIAARAKLGDFAAISSDERLPRMVWVIGHIDRTLGVGATWDEALAKARPAPSV